MLIRKQVMMTNWLDEHIRKMAEQYDVSYSEVIRLSSSLALSLMACEIFCRRSKGSNISF